MNDTYVEHLVKAEAKWTWKALKAVLVTLTVLLVLLALMGAILFFVFAIATGVGIYLVNRRIDVEYEYLYLDRELTIDRIIGKSKRKRLAVYKLEGMEIMAPEKSHQLDSLNNRPGIRVKDYSAGDSERFGRKFAFFYEGGEKVIISPSPEMVKVMKMMAPRTVFLD